MSPAIVQTAAKMMAYPNRLYRSMNHARPSPTRAESIGAGALRRLARMLVKPSDWMMVAPHVLSPPTDCSPLRQASR